MITYPVIFKGSARTTSGISTSWDIEASGTSLKCSVPKEFEGSGEFPSPEDYFLQAAMNCFIATFKVYAHYSKFAFDELNVSSHLIVDKNDDNKPCMKHVELDVHLKGIANQERARLLVDKAIANGFILQSLKSTLNVNLVFDR